ncbi:MAG: NAD(P)/FAD-dependent oxidoreductase [Acidobacteriota bacterium]
MSRPDAIVVGAGIVGAACADALAAAELKVLVLEAGIPGGGSTAAGMGHLVVMDDSAAEIELTRSSLELWRGWSGELPADVEDDPCGTLWVAADDEEMALARRKSGLYRGRGVEAEILDPAALREAEPELRSGLAGALLVPGDRVLYPPNAAAFLLERARKNGAELRVKADVVRLAPGRVEGREGAVEAGLVVLATGVWAPRLLPGLPIEPRKGHLVISDRYPGFVRHQLVELGYLKSAHGGARESVAFNVQPRATGQVLIGSSREFVGFDESLNVALRTRMLRRAFEYLPGLQRLQAIRTWTGFRPSTPDKLPLIGEWERGLYVAAGHEGLGITTAPATGRLIAELATGAATALDPRPFDPHRRFAEKPADG